MNFLFSISVDCVVVSHHAKPLWVQSFNVTDSYQFESVVKEEQ